MLAAVSSGGVAVEPEAGQRPVPAHQPACGGLSDAAEGRWHR
jgi:hypothetical protein